MRAINKINTDKTLLELIFREKIKNNTTVKDGKQSSRLDTVFISDEAREFANTNKSYGVSVNTSIDKSVDLERYLKEANGKNQENIENPGDSIKSSNNYISKAMAYRKALNAKYSRLVSIAKCHSNPTNYIYQKYYDQLCTWYESDLSESERQIAYRYEMDVLKTGEICGIKMGDSLFRNLEENTISSIDLRINFNRDIINAQIRNILQKKSISISNQSTITFSVDPYTYYINVSCLDKTLSEQIEQVLNVGENGKNLYHHIRECSIQDGAKSTQISDIGYKKYQLFHQLYELTGLDISSLVEKKGSYYTDDGINILDIVNEKISESGLIPDTHKSSMKEWIAQMVSDIALGGWDNIPNMVLKIDYRDGKLIDKYQSIQYGS